MKLLILALFFALTAAGVLVVWYICSKKFDGLIYKIDMLSQGSSDRNVAIASLVAEIKSNEKLLDKKVFSIPLTSINGEGCLWTKPINYRGCKKNEYLPGTKI